MDTARDPGMHRLSGVLFAGLAALAVLLSANVPTGDASATDIAAFYADSGERSRQLLAAWVSGLALAAFVWWLAALRATLVRDGGEHSLAPTLVLVGGTAWTALQLASSALYAVPAAAADYWGAYEGAPDVAMGFLTASFMLSNFSWFAGFLVPAGAAWAGLRRQGLPSWMGMASTVATAAALAATLHFAAAYVVFLWVAVAGLALGRPSRP